MTEDRSENSCEKYTLKKGNNQIDMGNTQIRLGNAHFLVHSEYYIPLHLDLRKKIKENSEEMGDGASKNE